MKISIIVPIYNIEQYIKQCIESIINQSYKDLEIILINDGSQDKSEEICKKYAKEDTRIKYLYKENGGLASARNLGLENATGEYLMYIDGDDYLYNNDCISKLVKKLLDNNNPDVLLYKMINYYPTNNTYSEYNDIAEDGIYINISKLLETTVERTMFSISQCDKLVKRSIVENNKLRFNKTIMEDLDFSYRLYFYIKSIYVYNETIYVYRQARENSITHELNLEKVTQMLALIKKWLEYDYEGNKEFKDIYYNYLAYQYTILIARVNNNNSNKDIRKQLKELKWLLEYNKSFKVKKAYKLKKVFGYNIMVLGLKTYLYLSRKNILRI